jgi:hypothetical protein
MAETSPRPFPSQSGRHVPGHAAAGAGRSRRGSLLALVAVVLASALLGLLGGIIWAHSAPRVVYVVVSGGAQAVNPETSAFIVADAWFCLIGVAGGLISGLLGYQLAVRRYGALPMVGIFGGGLAAAYVVMWVGQRAGRAAFESRLVASKPGTLLRAPIMLGAHGALAFWPLAAGLVAGGLEAVAMMRERQRALARLGAQSGARAYGPAAMPFAQPRDMGQDAEPGG